MPTAGFTQPPLRGYVPDGELDVLYDIARTARTIEIAFWEGCDRPFLKSVALPGSGLTWIRPNPTTGLGGEPWWNLGPQPASYQAGAPHSGHVGMSSYVTNVTSPGAPGYRWNGVIDPVLSEFVIGRNYSVLVVGEPMAYMNPALDPTTISNTWRNLWTYRNAGNTAMQFAVLNYNTQQIRWQHYGIASIASPIIPFYGKRVAMLFVNGDEFGTTPPPRVFIAAEGECVQRADFSTPGTYSMWDAKDLELFQAEGPKAYQDTGAGGCWEYYAHFIRSFEDQEARAICRDALGLVKWDPYVVRRIGWQAPPTDIQLIATPGSYGRVAARPTSFGRVAAAPSIYQRVSATPRYTGPRVSASPNTFPRISARIRIAAEEVFDVQATPLCPSEMNWEADNVLELADVLDDMPDTPTEITSADSVTCEIYDRATGLAVTASPVTLNQVGSTNTWRNSVLTDAAGGFAKNMRLLLVFIFDGGAGLHGRFSALAVVGSATS